MKETARFSAGCFVKRILQDSVTFSKEESGFIIKDVFGTEKNQFGSLLQKLVQEGASPGAIFGPLYSEKDIWRI